MALSFAIFCSLQLFYPHLLADTSPFNTERLNQVINSAADLIAPYGKMQIRMWHISKDKISAGDAAPFDVRQMDEIYLPKNPEFILEAPPKYLSDLVVRMEQLLFSKKGVVRFGLTKNMTAAYIKEKSISLGKDVLRIESGNPFEKENLAFVVAHEFAHLVIFNQEIKTGFTPSGFITTSREIGNYSFSQEEYKVFIDTIEFPKEAPLAHAEVDLLACMILKRLGEKIPPAPLDGLMNDRRFHKQTTHSLEVEYKERLKALELCRSLK